MDREHRMQVAAVNEFRYRYPDLQRLLVAVPNGGFRGKSQARKLKAEGVVSGVSDLVLFVPSGKYHALCLEAKVYDPKTYQSPSQKSWQKLVEAQGYKYEVFRTPMELMQIVSKYLKNED